MKKIVLHIMLLTFVFQSTCNFWILISFYANREYIAENICINRFDQMPVCKGQCFLNKQLKETQKQEQKLPDLKGKEIQLFINTLEVAYNEPVFFFQETSRPDILPDFTLIKQLPSSIFHPPKLA
ncbi:hypothetical protein ACI6PS_01305 [Flavobacterium sp. PLA-1-15]|uniref:hypothetical protein n=1 Tax=Flavobacterium sp. PLA-1-15 TaxID=3380533 RepID=UPI003B76176D